MSKAVAGDGVTVTYTVKAPSPAPTTTVPLDPQPTPSVVHHPLPYTGAPVTLELIGSFGLLLAGALAAWSAHRRPQVVAGAPPRRPEPGPGVPRPRTLRRGGRLTGRSG